jgi:transposase
MSLYSAIDLHSNNGVLSIIDGDDRVQFERRLPNELAAVLGALEPYRERISAIAVESTYNWYWLVDGLMEHGYDVRLVNTAAVPQYDGLKHGNDHTDARHLAHLLRLGILPEGFIYPREQRGVRDLLRRRFHLVHQAVSLAHAMQAAWSRRSGHGISVNALRQITDEDIGAAFVDPMERLAVLAQLKVWRVIEQQVDQVEKWVLDAIKPSPGLKALRTTPGIGVVLGSTIVLETGPINRFAQVGDYASYCRMVDSKRLSNGKKKGSGNAKCGNGYLCWAFIEAANYAVRYSEEVRRWCDRKASKRLRVVAIKATAHKLARSSYYLLRDGGEFDVKRAFG